MDLLFESACLSPTQPAFNFLFWFAGNSNFRYILNQSKFSNSWPHVRWSSAKTRKTIVYKNWENLLKSLLDKKCYLNFDRFVPCEPVQKGLFEDIFWSTYLWRLRLQLQGSRREYCSEWVDGLSEFWGLCGESLEWVWCLFRARVH